MAAAMKSDPNVGITGVAPWQMSSGSLTEQPVEKTGIDTYGEAADSDDEKKIADDPALPATERVARYIARCRPKEVQEDRTWEQALAAEAPTLLPSLKFHELVFGRDLGEGGFSTLRAGFQVV